MTHPGVLRTLWPHDSDITAWEVLWSFGLTLFIFSHILLFILFSLAPLERETLMRPSLLKLQMNLGSLCPHSWWNNWLTTSRWAFNSTPAPTFSSRQISMALVHQELSHKAFTRCRLIAMLAVIGSFFLTTSNFVFSEHSFPLGLLDFQSHHSLVHFCSYFLIFYVPSCVFFSGSSTYSHKNNAISTDF